MGAKFIEVCESNDYGFNRSEVIPVENLVKMFKGEGDFGETIHFVFDDVATRRLRTFIADYGHHVARDIAYEEYKKQLGCAQSTRRAQWNEEEQCSTK